jgi:hypothetical protein
VARDNPVSPETFAAGLPARVLHCRELGHTWKDFTVQWDPGARAYVRALRCASCRTVRHQIIDGSGTALRNSYTYADGYLAKTGTVDGRLERSIFRLEAITRFLTAAEAAPIRKAI